MKLPLFYKPGVIVNDSPVFLDEPTSKHVIQVLRMQLHEKLQLTDGVGNLYTVEIIDSNRKKCEVKVLETAQQQRPVKNISIAISLIKNNSRFEWFLEKATEIGVTEIIPLICERSEKQNFRLERMQGILISAMLQSQQTWLPVLYEPVKLMQLITSSAYGQKMIAHCEETGGKKTLMSQPAAAVNKLILIGPEGDFTKAEIEAALAHDFAPVTLGHTRLRTETAGLVAASLLCNI